MGSGGTQLTEVSIEIPRVLAPVQDQASDLVASQIRRKGEGHFRQLARRNLDLALARAEAAGGCGEPVLSRRQVGGNKASRLGSERGGALFERSGHWISGLRGADKRDFQATEIRD